MMLTILQIAFILQVKMIQKNSLQAAKLRLYTT